MPCCGVVALLCAKRIGSKELDTLNGKPGCVVSTWRQEVVENWFDYTSQASRHKVRLQIWRYLNILGLGYEALAFCQTFCSVCPNMSVMPTFTCHFKIGFVLQKSPYTPYTPNEIYKMGRNHLISQKFSPKGI